MHTSIARSLKSSRVHLVQSSRDFRQLLKEVEQSLRQAAVAEDDDAAATAARRGGFAASKACRAVHHTRKPFRISLAMRSELRLIYEALTSDWIDMWRPIGHLIRRLPSGLGYSDSCLHAAGGYSLDMGYWWYIEWPDNIKNKTLKFVFNDKDGTLVSINALEYAALIVNYVAATYVLSIHRPSPKDPHPAVLLKADNRTAESWLVKASKSSQAGRALGYIQASLMINNPVGINVEHVTSKDNKIADRILCILSESVLLTKMQSLHKDHPSLTSRQRFHPSAELISLISATLSTKSFVDPLQISRRVLKSPGWITT